MLNWALFSLQASSIQRLHSHTCRPPAWQPTELDVRGWYLSIQ